MIQIRIIPIVGLLVVLTSTAFPAYPANRYVREGAAGAANGSDWNNAYTSLPATLIRGDKYYIADGTYGSYRFDDAASGTTPITITKATEADHGTDTGWNANYGDGEAVFRAAGQIWVFTGSYYVIDGVVGSGKAPGTYGIRLYSTENRCSGTTISQLLSTSSSITLRHIEWDWNNGTAGCTSEAPVLLGANGSRHDDILIEHSYFHHSPAYAFFAGNYPGDEVSNRWTVRNNYFYRIGGGGGTSAHWEMFWWMNIDNSQISNNTFEDIYGTVEGQTGWLMVGRTDNLVINGNLFFCSSSTYCLVGGNGVIATWSNDIYKNTSIHIYNNTFANLTGGYGPQINFFHNSVDDTDIRAKNNLYFNSSLKWTGVDVQSHEACGGGQSCSGSNQQTGITSSVFQNYSGRDFRLTSATAAGDTSVGTKVSEDSQGNTRGTDGLWDRGAFEFGASLAKPSPPTDVAVN